MSPQEFANAYKDKVFITSKNSTNNECLPKAQIPPVPPSWVQVGVVVENVRGVVQIPIKQAVGRWRRRGALVEPESTVESASITEMGAHNLKAFT